ncbi:hypothetical protein B296_00057862 [Ensete ventricosum]|uniref:Uncharacterized protein n=1 Tax=Ensete ventricosum TaxID=4639 RepID=A0A426XLP0_ENSVE|nr:hypothetical protein B296_00057862 [Ensete ventricosum]
MKSACCKHEIVIQTDPKNCEYVIISGAQRKTEDYDIEDAETFALPADEVIVATGSYAVPCLDLRTKREGLRKKRGYRGGWALASGFSLLRKKMRQ